MTQHTSFHPRILIVADDGATCEWFRRVLQSPGLQANAACSRCDLVPARRESEALRLVQRAAAMQRPFAVVLLVGPHGDADFGFASVEALLRADRELHVVLGIGASEGGGEGIACDELLARFGANPRVLPLRRPLVAAEVVLLVASLIEKWRLLRETAATLDRQAAQIVSAQRVISVIESCLEELEAAHDELRQHATALSERLRQRTTEVLGTRDLTMFALAHLADSRDPETGEHLLRMRAYAQLLAEDLAIHGPHAARIDERFLDSFYRSTPLHDIGKVGIPDQILLKPGALTDEEFEVMKQHTRIGAESLEAAAHQNGHGDFLAMAAAIARWHHEKYDGTGYPDGLRGEAIPLEARITALADVFDALTSARVYKAAMDPSDAKRIIESEEGKHFDPAVVAAFRRCFDKFLAARRLIDADLEQVARPTEPAADATHSNTAQAAAPRSEGMPWFPGIPLGTDAPMPPVSR